MRILLTGATGFLGYRTLEKLVTLDYITSIVATGRNLLQYRKIESSKVNYKLGNLEDEHFVNSLVEGIDIIINTVSLSSPWGKASDFFLANIQTQSNLIRASKINGVKKIIYISSPSVYFDGTNKILLKESDALPTKFINEYAKTKREAEIMLEQASIPFVILRPRALIGRGDSIIMPRLIKAYDEGKLKIIGNGDNVVDLTSVENVVEAIILSLNAKEVALNQIYNITNDEPVSLWKSIESVLNALEKPLSKSKIPYKIAYYFARFLEIKAKLNNNKEPTLTAYSVGTLGLSFTLDITKAKELLGYRPITTTQQSIDEFVKWYISNEKV
ncbi:MAG: NAD-dependent epimerase/dehydratase family protein [Bacteroidia bacterium]|nr:NAD-dependent epimerase/dehydratase family protein [Bacteroidia bacterium]MCF8427939.1 NAD-dependent epimerase/dehydratase family protein [Bacteroidia bacterium]MCF8447439.1 NAD-dependent epimerase/dehydratase family protein [Bacteroidia bacterium]